MQFSITEALHDWMNKRRIISAVAQKMGKNATTLSAELRPSRYEAKLGADELVPLFNAIREIGYGDELNGILFRYIKSLKGEANVLVADDEIIPLVLQLSCVFSSFTECMARVPKSNDEEELIRVRRVLRTEILPALLKMEDLLEGRLRKVRGRRKGFLLEPSVNFVVKGNRK